MYVFAIISQFQSLLDGEVSTYLVERMGLVFVDSLGGFDTPESHLVAWAIFLLLQIITNIVVLNTLIAILGDSYDNVQNEQVAYDTKQKIELLSEMNDFLKGFSKAGTEEDKKYIIIVRYYDKNAGAAQWEGKIKMITKEIKSQGTLNEQRFKKMNSRFDMVMSKIDNLEKIMKDTK